jgi:hypothetical protein
MLPAGSVWHLENQGAIMSAMLECSNRDIAAARTLHDEIKKVLKAHEQGERNDAMLREIKVLCSCIIQTIRDPYCQEKMCEVEIHSDELFAVDNRTRWSRSTQPSPIFLRRLILKSLEAFDDRLRAVEMLRQSDHGVRATGN